MSYSIFNLIALGLDAIFVALLVLIPMVMVELGPAASSNGR